MLRFYSLILMVMLGSCAKEVPPEGVLGSCNLPFGDLPDFPGTEICTDYRFTTSATRDLTSEARTLAETTCSGLEGTWTANEQCSTTVAVGHCTYTTTQTAASDNYTFIYRQVFGVAFAGGATELQTFCETANVSPISTVWQGL